MKILHLCSQDDGGAGRAAVRLHQALLKANVDSYMIVQKKSSDLPTIEQLAKSKAEKFFINFRIALQYIPTLFYTKREKDIFSCNPFFSNRKLLKRIREINPDIIHLHWINNGFFNIKDLTKMHKPMLWSLHDANPYTGGCHYVAPSCVGVGSHCQKCPLLHSNFSYDLSYWTFKAKQKTYKKLDLTINGLSKWITQCAKESTLFQGKKIINLPNVIDTEIFRPVEKNVARDLLHIQTQSQKKLIVFGAISGTQVPRKGYLQLKEALEALPNKEDYELVVFGSSCGEEIAGIKTHFLGHLYDDLTLKILYSSATITLVPSLSESFGQVALESLACGTPVVAFDCTGLQDIITHQVDGYLAKPFDSLDLCNGILWISNLDCKAYEILCQNAINKAKTSFSYESTTNKYQQAYDEILANLLGGGGSKKLIGFGAISGTQVPRKGYLQLKEALEALPNKEDYELVVFGSSCGEEIAGIKTHFLGHLYDDLTLCLVYNCLDVFVTPSLAENLSNAIMESLACGTPVVAFKIGGNGDMITHKSNGYLAKDTNDLKEGIVWVLNQADYAHISTNARKSVIERFSDRIKTSDYINLYTTLISSKEKDDFT